MSCTAAEGYIVTIGITPTHPATGFGYIHSVGPLQVAGAPNAQVVAEFVEKPDEQVARGYLAAGECPWWTCC